jgi:hypothetical protein
VRTIAINTGDVEKLEDARATRGALRCGAAIRQAAPEFSVSDKPPLACCAETLSLLFGRSRSDRAASLHLGLQAGDLQQVGELFESVLACDACQIGR